MPLITADGTTGHLGLTTNPQRPYDEDDLEFFTIVAGRVALVLANARLVTDLRSTRARLDGILNSLAEAVTVNDDQGRTVYVNPAATRLLGLTQPADLTHTRPGELAARFEITDEHGEPGARSTTSPAASSSATSRRRPSCSRAASTSPRAAPTGC